MSDAKNGSLPTGYKLMGFHHPNCPGKGDGLFLFSAFFGHSLWFYACTLVLLGGPSERFPVNRDTRRGGR